MTEQEKTEAIERAWDGWLESDGSGHSAIRNALEAVGFFELVEAGDAVVEQPSNLPPVLSYRLRTALTKAKGQTND